jgi:hypothetical protein
MRGVNFAHIVENQENLFIINMLYPICNQGVAGSNPATGTILFKGLVAMPTSKIFENGQ